MCRCGLCLGFFNNEFLAEVHTNPVAAVTNLELCFLGAGDFLDRSVQMTFTCYPRIIRHIAEMHPSDPDVQEVACRALGHMVFFTEDFMVRERPHLAQNYISEELYYLGVVRQQGGIQLVESIRENFPGIEIIQSMANVILDVANRV